MSHAPGKVRRRTRGVLAWSREGKDGGAAEEVVVGGVQLQPLKAVWWACFEGRVAPPFHAAESGREGEGWIWIRIVWSGRRTPSGG